MIRRETIGGWAFFLALGTGTALRLWASTLGWNYDVESYWIVAHILDAGNNVWAHTDRLNYGPVWPAITWLLLRVETFFGATSVETFHVLAASVLTLADIGIALCLARAVGRVAATLFFLCPVSILITGYHSQIDTLAIFFALWSWQMLERDTRTSGFERMLRPGILLGISLATKHVFAFFPLWFLLRRDPPLMHRMAYAAVAYGVFLASFAPFVLTPNGWDGVMQHVVQYQGAGYWGNALLPRFIHGAHLWVPAFVAALMGVGLLMARLIPDEIFFLYPVALVAFSTTIADQYLAIPIISFAAYRRAWPMWAYVAAATLALLGSRHDVGALEPMQGLATHLRAAGFVLMQSRYSSLYPQLCLLLFLAWRTVAEVKPIILARVRARAAHHRVPRPREPNTGARKGPERRTRQSTKRGSRS